MTDIEKKKAKAEIAKWFWQPAEGHNFRYKYAIRTLTRFYEMVTPAADTLKLVLEYLRTQEIEGPISLLGKKADLGSGWVAKDAWYTTATGDQFANTKQNKVRVYQTLMLASEDAADGDGPYTVEDGCQYAIDHTFYWNVAELPTLSSSSSGVQYTMQGVTRDGDTGLFSCVIEKRERVQQDVELYDTAKTIFETVQEEQHLGVKSDDVATTGQKASAANGVLVKRQLRKNPDCTTDVINETTTEEPVLDAVVQYRKTLRSSVKSTTHRNQQNPLTDGTEKDGTPLVPGETRRSDKTPGQRYNNTVEKSEAPKDNQNIARSCQGSSMIHTDTTVESVPAEQKETDHVTPEANKEKEISYRMNDDGVTKDKTTVTREWQPRTATISWTGNGGTYTYTSFSHQPTKPTFTTPDGGTASATISQNTEGTYDGTITTFTPDREAAGEVKILKQTYDETHIEEEVLPGGRRMKREVKLNITVGYAALATALTQFAESKAWKGYRGSYTPVGTKNGWYRKINSVTFGAWSYVQ